MIISTLKKTQGWEFAPSLLALSLSKIERFACKLFHCFPPCYVQERIALYKRATVSHSLPLLFSKERNRDLLFGKEWITILLFRSQKQLFHSQKPKSEFLTLNKLHLGSIWIGKTSFTKIFFFSKIFAKNMCMHSHSHRLRWHNVSVVNNYVDTMSALSLSTLTPLTPCQWCKPISCLHSQQQVQHLSE